MHPLHSQQPGNTHRARAASKSNLTCLYTSTEAAENMPMRKVLSFSTYSKIQHKSPSSLAKYAWKQGLKVKANKAVQNQALSKHRSALSNANNYIPGQPPPDLLSTQPWCLLEARYSLWPLESHLPLLHRWGKPPGHSSPGGPWLLYSWSMD